MGRIQQSEMSRELHPLFHLVHLVLILGWMHTDRQCTALSMSCTIKQGLVQN